MLPGISDLGGGGLLFSPRALPSVLRSRCLNLRSLVGPGPGRADVAVHEPSEKPTCRRVPPPPLAGAPGVAGRAGAGLTGNPAARRRGGLLGCYPASESPVGGEVKAEPWPRFQSAQRLLCPPGRLSPAPVPTPKVPALPGLHSRLSPPPSGLLLPARLPPPAPLLKSFVSISRDPRQYPWPRRPDWARGRCFPLLITGGSETPKR